MTGTVEYIISGDSNGCTIDSNGIMTSGDTVGTVTVNVTVAADTYYYALTTIPISATIIKPNAIPATVTANNRTYDDTEQPLVTVTGKTTGGTMHYTVTTVNIAPLYDKLYTTSIPTATAAGTYYVWYKVKGDNNHTDTTSVCISVTISGSKGIDSLPQTGDTERPLLYGLAFLAACIGLGLLIRKK